MEQEEEFENLKKDLENKSNQIKNLKAEISNHQQSEEIPAIELDLQSSPRIKNVEKLFKRVSTTDQEFPTFMTPLLNGPITENVIKNYQHQLESMQRKLRISTEMCTEQELNYQNIVKDMELKFRQMLGQRDEFIKLRESESNNQQQLISHLQIALEKMEKEKLVFQEDVANLNKAEYEKNIEVETLHKEIELYKNTFKSLSIILLPDVRNFASNKVEAIDEITLNSLSSMLEKVLMIHKKQQDLLTFQVQSLENKINENEKSCEEKLNYEKKLVEIQQQEQLNNYNLTIEAKNIEINNLSSQVNTLQTKVQNLQKKFKEEIIKYKANIGESKKLSEMKYNRICEERNSLKETLEKLQQEHRSLSENNDNLFRNFEELRLNNEANIIELEKNIVLRGELQRLQDNLKLLENAKELKDIEFGTSVKSLEEQLSEKENECKNLRQKVLELTDESKKDVQKATMQTREEEKVKYDKKMEEVNLIIENHKRILENANLDLSYKNELLNTNLNKVKDLEDKINDLQQEIHDLREKNNHEKAIIAQRDGRVIDLQLKMTELKEKLRTKEEVEYNKSSLLQTTQQLNVSLENKLSVCEKEKSDLQHSNTLLKEKYKTMEEEVGKLISVLNERNNEVSIIKRDRKAMAKKLKEKSDSLSAEKKDNESSLNLMKALRRKNDKLNHICEELRNKTSSLSEIIDHLEQDKKAMEEMLTEQEDLKDKEISNLLSRLHGSEGDILKLKGVLKRYKMSDSNGVKLASITQKTITKQRAEVDSLMSKISWLKEALEVSEKTRNGLQDGIDSKEKQLKKLNEKLTKQKEENQQLSVNLTSSKRETIELQRALEEAAVKYTDVYALVEKQEQCLARDTKKRLWFNEKQQKKLYEDRDVFHSTRMPDKTDESMNTKELKSLLQDVRGLLSSTLKREVPFGKPKLRQLHSEKEPNRMENTSISSEKIIIIEPGLKENTQKLNEYLLKHSTASSISLGNLSAPINSTPRTSPRHSSPQDDDTVVLSVYSNVDYTSDEDTMPLQVTGSWVNDEEIKHVSNKDTNAMPKRESKRQRSSVVD